jgi:uncharacterized protein (UPF0262 family)
MEDARTAASGRLIAVEIDAPPFAGPASLPESERAVAVRDLVAENRFLPAGRGGAFRLRLSLADRKLVLDVADAKGTPIIRHILSLKPLSRVIRDYALVYQSYNAAIGSTTRARLEAIDMGRRGIHNEGATILKERLKGKIDMDFETARRLFTLVCALVWRGDHQA